MNFAISLGPLGRLFCPIRFPSSNSLVSHKWCRYSVFVIRRFTVVVVVVINVAYMFFLDILLYLVMSK